MEAINRCRKSLSGSLGRGWGLFGCCVVISCEQQTASFAKFEASFFYIKAARENGKGFTVGEADKRWHEGDSVMGRGKESDFFFVATKMI